jgi:L-lactate dehydrogenase (cytochrome)
MPFGIAPMGITALSAYRGDLILAQAAAAANALMVMSGSSLIRLEDVAQVSKGAWFQAYLPGDVPRITALIERVSRSSFDTLVVTVDSQVAGNRENNIRSGFSTPLRPTLRLAVGRNRPSAVAVRHLCADADLAWNAALREQRRQRGRRSSRRTSCATIPIAGI